ncbi:MAG: type II secretion system F family protein [Planctomycetes bacterium]|nr:type II secretion system F family protein [Planctomycetota bacterium]
MPNFVYNVRDASGMSASGMIDAPTLDEAGRLLRRDGKFIIDLHPQGFQAVAMGSRTRRVRSDDLVFFCNQLAVMVDTGVPLLEALDGIAEQTSHTGLKAMVSQIANDVRGGTEFSAALARFPKVFDGLFVSMIQASEASGTMGSALERMCAHLRGQREIRSQVRGAMFYPVGILVFSVGILTAMMVFVLPRFEKIYTAKKAALPLATRLLLGASDALLTYWPWILCGLGAGLIAALRFLRTERGGYAVDRMRLRLPLVRDLYEKVYISRSFRTLATMLASGVELLDAIAIASAVVGNRLHRDMWIRIAGGLREGRTLAEEVAEAPLMPRSMAQMIASGDRSGRVGDVLNRIADFCDNDVRVGVKALTSLIEPAMIVLMGLIVGGIAMALLLPVFSINKVVGR